MSFKDALLDLFGLPHGEPEGKGRKDAVPPTTPTPKKRAGAAPAPRASKADATRPPSTERDEAAVLAAVRAAGGNFRRVVLTSNRRVMASVAAGGAELRLNTAFASAPDRVLAAVATLFTTRDGRKRSAARAAVRRFITEIPQQAAAPRAPRKRRILADDRPHLERLRAEFDRVNLASFGGELPRVPLFLSGQMRRRNGHFSRHPLEIVISRRLCTHGHEGEAEQTLRHEMIHLWQHATERPVDHGLEFRRMARQLDVHPRATRAVRWREE